MSKINDLIKELCPDGVIYKSLGSFCDIKTGAGVTKKDIVENGKYKIISGGIVPMGMCDKTNRNGNTVTIARAGTAGFINYIKDDFYLNDKCFSVIPKEEKIIDNKYLYYSLSNIQNKIYELKSSGTVPTVNTEKVSKIVIPIPPIEVQEEIVRILDKFGELEAELEARKSQYEFWRGYLLNSKSDRVKLQDVAYYSKDRISFNELNADNYVGVDNLLQNKMGKVKSSHVPVSGNSTKFDKDDILIGNIRPYLRKIWIADCSGGTNGDVLDIRVKDKKQVFPRFLYYVLSSEVFFEYNNSNSKGAKMPRGDKQAVMDYEFNVPTLDVQKRIVDILDKFDALVNDISIGIPAEIELRRKQYEYYRNKLLSFEELSVSE